MLAADNLKRQDTPTKGIAETKYHTMDGLLLNVLTFIPKKETRKVLT